jgi:hypothetical protein
MYDRQTLSTSRAIIVAAALSMAFTLVGCKSAPPVATDDTSLTAALQGRIAGDGALSAEPIQSAVKDRIATLSGTVSNEAARALASADAAQVAGIKTVVNNLTVQAPAPIVTAVAAPPPPPPPAPKPAALKANQPPVIKPRPAPIVRNTPPPVDQAPEVAYVPPPPPPAQELPPPPPPPPPAPTFRNITIPPDTAIPVRITETLDSATTQQGDLFTGTIATDIFIDGLVVLRQGTPVSGRVVAVQEAAHYKGSSLLSIELTSINRRCERFTITTDAYSVKGDGRGKNTAEKVGGGAAVGAILGGILGGGKGAAIGAAAGGGVGAGANTVTRGQQVKIASETLVRFNLTNPLSIKVPAKETDSTTTSPNLQPHTAPPPQL